MRWLDLWFRLDAFGLRQERPFPEKTARDFRDTLTARPMGFRRPAGFHRIQPAYLHCGLGGLLTVVRFPCCLFGCRGLGTMINGDLPTLIIQQTLQGRCFAILDGMA